MAPHGERELWHSTLTKLGEQGVRLARAEDDIKAGAGASAKNTERIVAIEVALGASGTKQQIIWSVIAVIVATLISAGLARIQAPTPQPAPAQQKQAPQAPAKP